MLKGEARHPKLKATTNKTLQKRMRKEWAMILTTMSTMLQMALISDDYLKLKSILDIPQLRIQRKYSGAGFLAGTPLLSYGAASKIL